MHKYFLLLAFFALTAGSAAALDAPGTVNFTSCLTDSKYGKKEQENFDNLRGQMASLIENTEKELKEISAKFEDTEYLDSLSPKAEEELKTKFQTLQEDLNRYQNQFYQVLNHAHYQMVQKMSTAIGQAAEKVARKENLNFIMNKEACFYIRPELDFTSSIIAEMDRAFELDSKMKRLSENEAPSESSLNAEEVAENPSLELPLSSGKQAPQVAG